MNDFYIKLGIAAVIALVQDERLKLKWRKAILKVFREIARAFAGDDEFNITTVDVSK